MKYVILPFSLNVLEFSYQYNSKSLQPFKVYLVQFVSLHPFRG